MKLIQKTITRITLITGLFITGCTTKIPQNYTKIYTEKTFNKNYILDLNSDGYDDRISVIYSLGIGLAACLDQLEISLVPNQKNGKVQSFVLDTFSFSSDDLQDINGDGDVELIIRSFISANVLQSDMDDDYIVIDIVSIKCQQISIANYMINGYPRIISKSDALYGSPRTSFTDVKEAGLTPSQRLEIILRARPIIDATRTPIEDFKY